MKLCTDCKHCRKGWIIFPVFYLNRFNTCSHPAHFSPVDGSASDNFCSISRKYGRCGVKGNLWEAKAMKDSQP